MALIDRMETEFVLNPRQYTRGANQVVKDSDRAGHHIDKAKRQALDFSGTLGMAGRALSGLFTAVGAAGAGIVGLGVYAMKSAADFDTLQRTLTAVTGSAERAKEILSFVDELAIPSVFSSQVLADAAKTLEAFGLKTETYLPVVEKLGTVFGGTSEKIDQFVRALGYIKAGRFGEAFEALAAAGVSRQELGTKGLQFDKGGQFLGDAKQALDAVEQLVQEKYGKLADEMASGPAARLASLWDQVQRGIRAAGTELLKGFLPYIDLVAEKVGAWVQDGTFAKVGKYIADLFAPRGVITQGVLTLAAGLMEIPNVIKYIGSEMAGVYNQIVDWVNGFAEVYNKLAAIASLVAGVAINIPEAPTLSKVARETVTPPMQNIESRREGWTKALEDAFATASQRQESKPSGVKLPSPVQEELASRLDAIEENTGALVEINKRQLSLQEGALGGASAGRGLMGREYGRLTGRQAVAAG